MIPAAARSVRRAALGARLPCPVRPGARVSSYRELNAQTTASDAQKLKTIKDLPGPSFARTLYWILFKGFADKAHLMQGFQRDLFGPIWVSKFGQYELVNVASAELIRQVIKQEGRYPVRILLPHWKEYMDMRNKAYGLHVGTGPEWYQIRTALNQKMLKPREMQSYVPVVQDVVEDLMKRLEVLRQRSPDRTTVPDVASELYKFGFEGISSILFESRLGCLQEEVPTDTLRFISAVNTMLIQSNLVPLIPRWMRSFLPNWKLFVQAYDDLFEISEKLVNRRVKELEEQIKRIEEQREQTEEQKSRGSSLDGLYLTVLLLNKNITRGQIYSSITELLLGGVDTTSNTLSWTLYHLARDLRVQDILAKEVLEVCPNLKQPSTDDLSQMPYLKAIIKEILRLYPVVPGNSRYMTEHDVVVGGYWFPKETTFHLCHYAVTHSADEFPEPERFIPERWLRPGDKTDGTYSRSLHTHHPYSSIPFGVGTRACVGKRVAELEMYIALSRLIQRYEFRPEDGAPVVEAKTRTLLIPGSPINLRLLHRA